MFEDSSVVAEVHARLEARLRATGPESGRLSVEVTVPQVPDDAPWWVREPDVQVYLAGTGPSFDAAALSVADVNGEELRHSDSDGAATIEGRPLPAATVEFGNVANGRRVTAEFDVVLHAVPEPGQGFAYLRVLHSFGTRRLDGAESLGAGIPLVAERVDGGTVVRLGEPSYWVNVDEAEDCDPAVDPNCEQVAPDVIYTYDTTVVAAGGDGPCPHAWCLESWQESRSTQ